MQTTHRHAAVAAGTGGAGTFTATVTATGNRTAIGSDNSFGPQYGSTFDFTLLFNDAILTIVPTALLISACPFYIYAKRQRAVKVERGGVFWAKLVVAFCLFAIQVAQLGLWTSSVSVSTEHDWGIAAGTLSCFAALCIGLLFNTEHRRSIQPSTLLSIYFGVTVFLDGAKARSYLLRNGLDTIGAVQVVITVAKFVLLILEEVPKTPDLRDKNLRDFLGREALSGFWTRTVLLWLNEVFLIGFRRTITMDDLGNLAPEYSTESLTTKFQAMWSKVDKSKRLALVKTLLRMHWFNIISIVPSRVLFSICSYAQPFLVYHAVNVVDKKDLSSTEKHSLIIATVLVYGGIALFRAMHTHQTNRTSVLINGTLLGIIYTKLFHLQAAEANKGAALTHISADLGAITTSVRAVHDLWLSFVELGFLTYFLYLYISYSCFLLFISASVSTLWALWFGPRAGHAHKVWNGKSQDRVSQTTQILAQSKQVKLLGLQRILVEYIQGLRVNEIKFSQRFRTVECVIVSMIMLAACFTPVIIIAGALFLSEIPLPLQAGRIFATLTIVTLAGDPMYVILHSYPILHGAISCADRVQSFLLVEDWVDGRSNGPLQFPNPESTEKALAGADVSENKSWDKSIAFLGASVTPAGGQQPFLQNVNVVIPQSALAIATGPSGSGKSTFLKCIAGESDISSGVVSVNRSSLAYCDQKPWLRNGTIRNNIVGENDYDDTWYRRVIRACCLDQDLAQMPQGDESKVGTNGSKLSGGQKHRVAVARALYPRAEVVLLDDLFSALDRPTANAIFRNLFGANGLLTTLKSTVVLATHSEQYLGAADLILEFTSDRSVTQSVGRGDRTLAFSAEQIESTDTHEGSPSAQEPENTEAATKLAVLTESMQDHHKGDMELYLFFFKTAPAWMFAVFFAAAIVNTVAERASPIFMRYWVEHHGDSTKLFPAYAALGIAPCLAYIAFNISFWQQMVPRFSNTMHQMLVDSMFGATITYLTSIDLGYLVNRISEDMTAVTQQFSECIFKVPYAGIAVVTDVAIIASASDYSVLLMPFIFVNFYFIQLVYLRTSRQLRLLDLAAKTPLYSMVAEVASGIEHIRAFGWQEPYLSRCFELVDLSQRPHYFMKCLQTWLALVIDCNNLVVAIILMMFAIYWGRTTTQSGVGLAYIGLLGLSQSFDAFLGLWIALETSLGSIARLKSFVTDTPQEQDPAEPARLPTDWPEKGEIKFTNVSAQYETDDGPQAVLRDVSMGWDGGQSVGIVGRTGSGKSSLFLTLAGGLPYEGSIKIDGIELNKIPLDTLRKRVAAIPQDTLTLPGTIRQNLMPWLLNAEDPAEAEQVVSPTVRKVLADTMVGGLIGNAGGMDINMEDFGMSAGEKQLFNVARSILLHEWFEARVVLMDEVSSNLDPEADDRLQWAIGEAFRGLTTCSIAHRTETLERANTIYRLDEGRVSLVKEDGDPSDALDPSMAIDTNDNE